MSRSLAAGELGKAESCGVESPADLPQVDFPWLAGSGSQSWLCGWLCGRLCGPEVSGKEELGVAGGVDHPSRPLSLIELTEDTGQIGALLSLLCSG